MRNIPFIPNARYDFDFRIMPGLTFTNNSLGFFNALMEKENVVMKDVMEGWYRDCAKNNGINLGEEAIFTESDFEIKIAKISENDDTLCIAIRLPEEDIESIIAVYHIFYIKIAEKGLIVKKPHLLVRHFTIEKSSPANVRMTREMARIYKQEVPSPYHLCELLPNNNRRNYGNAPNDVSNVDDIMIITTEFMKNTGGMTNHFKN
jgi:hypothetical protein